MDVVRRALFRSMSVALQDTTRHDAAIDLHKDATHDASSVIQESFSRQVT